MNERKFDLNIEKVLENWEVEHAIREIIANALDETALSGCRDIEILKDENGRWSVRDFGRGLRIEHFTMNENAEKLAGKAGVIGKFGVGLKDAVATLHRQKIEFIAESSHGRFRIEESEKVGFDGICTLHVSFSPQPDRFMGTSFIFENLPDIAMAKAKSLFLRFSNPKCLETVAFGEILERSADGGSVYVHGVKVSDEPNFLFSYNITSLTEVMRKRLNRERTNSGRALYADRIKAMLRDSTSEAVICRLVEQAEARGQGDIFDEMKWTEVAQKALSEMAKRKHVIYLTQTEVVAQHNILDNANRDNYTVTIVTEHEKEKLLDASNQDRQTIFIDDYRRIYNESFVYSFVDRGALHSSERQILELSDAILAAADVPKSECPPIMISETMRLDEDATRGVWDPNQGMIVINRTEIRALEAFAGTLLHEIIHMRTGLSDVSRDFETALTNYLGKIAALALRETPHPTIIGPPPPQTSEAPKGRGIFSRLFGRGRTS